MSETVASAGTEEFAKFARDITTGKKFSEFAVQAFENPKEFPRDFLKYLASYGYLGMDIPSEYGGSELTAQIQAAITEEFCRAHAGLGLSVLVANSLAAYPISKFGTEEQRGKYLPKMATGEIFGCFAITEPNVGSDAKAIEMKAIKDGDGFRIRGSKRFITNANGADICVFDARTGTTESRGKGISAFVSEIKNSPEVSVPKAWDKVGQPGSVLCDVVFNDLFVPNSALMNELNNGFDTVIAGTLAHSRVQIAAQGTGIAQSALDTTWDYGSQRKQNGEFLTEKVDWVNHFEVLKRQVELSRFLTQKAARHEDSGDPYFFVWASLAKLIAGETASRVAEDCRFLHGGIGYTREMRIAQICDDAAVIRIYEGTALIQTFISENYGIDEKKYGPLFPPANMLKVDPKTLPDLEEVKAKVEKWRIKPPKQEKSIV